MHQAHERHAIAAAAHIVATSVALPLGPYDAFPVQIHCAVGFITALSHTAQSYFLHSPEYTIAKPWRPRWAEYAITAPLMSGASYISAGGASKTAFMVIMGTGSLAQIFGLRLEAGKSLLWSMVLGGLLQAVSTVLIGMEVLQNDNEAPDVAAAVLYAVSFATFPMLAAIAARRDFDANTLDGLYVVLSVTSKLTMLAAAIVLEVGTKLWVVVALSIPTVGALALLAWSALFF